MLLYLDPPEILTPFLSRSVWRRLKGRYVRRLTSTISTRLKLNNVRLKSSAILHNTSCAALLAPGNSIAGPT
jgi:hypothetical protein